MPLIVPVEEEEGDYGMYEASVMDNTPTRSMKRPKTWQNLADLSSTLSLDKCCSTIVSRVVSIPANDSFNLTDVVRGATRSREETAVFDSHSFAGIAPAEELCGHRKADKGTVKSLLLSGAESSLETKLSLLWERRHTELQEGGDNAELREIDDAE